MTGLSLFIRLSKFQSSYWLWHPYHLNSEIPFTEVNKQKAKKTKNSRISTKYVWWRRWDVRFHAFVMALTISWTKHSCLLTWFPGVLWTI